jgi:hypothetical protein
MRWALLIIGILFILMGAVWALQGGNVLPYGQMAGHSRWTYIGAGLAAVGIVLTALGARRRGGKRTPGPRS